MFPGEVGQQLAAQPPWEHTTVLTDQVDDDDNRWWYTRQAAEHNWSRNVLEHHIHTALHTRVAMPPTPARVPLVVGESTFYVDLLFYHLHLRRYVVFDLKTGPAIPEAIGKLGFYLAAIDDLWAGPRAATDPRSTSCSPVPATIWSWNMPRAMSLAPWLPSPTPPCP